MVRAEVGEGSVARRLRKIKNLREEKDEHAKIAKAKQNEIDELTEIVLDEMQAIGVEKMSIVLEDGRSFSAYPTTRSYCRVTDQGEFLDWCKNEGVDPLSAYAINAGKLNSLYKERDEDSDSLPEGVEPYKKTSIGFRKSAK